MCQHQQFETVSTVSAEEIEAGMACGRKERAQMLGVFADALSRWLERLLPVSVQRIDRETGMTETPW
ncbi:MAG: hypothetical protein ACK5JT_23845 [Hyphomicrobiaceae bacterium]